MHMFKNMTIENFISWYIELGKLMIFWAKRVKDIWLVDENDGVFTIGVDWLIRRRIRKAVIAIAEEVDKVEEALTILHEYEDLTRILIIPEDYPLGLDAVDARGILYFWDVNSRILKPNTDVRIEILESWNNGCIKVFEGIHRKSWGFFIPPRPDDHVVLLGYLNDKPVALAYLNVNNFNIDYGIHVVRQYWRRRIGTRLLSEALRMAREKGSKYLSVVRVFRSLKGTAGDRRAVGFYRANNPSVKMAVYRLE